MSTQSLPVPGEETAEGYYQLGLRLSDNPARLDDALAAFQKSAELDPGSPRPVYRLALLLHENFHRPQEAEAAYRRAVELAPEDPYYYGGLINLLIQQDRRGEALELSRTMQALLNAAGNWYGLAALEAVLGNREPALDALQRAAQSPQFNRAWASSDPDLVSIRGDPRFDEIIQPR
jgi:tetratricopeptide (TPR) repeat protein